MWVFILTKKIIKIPLSWCSSNILLNVACVQSHWQVKFVKLIQTKKIEEHLEEGHEKELEMCRNKNLHEIIMGYQRKDNDKSSKFSTWERRDKQRDAWNVRPSANIIWDIQTR
mgnify:CR=1 FL=1